MERLGIRQNFVAVFSSHLLGRIARFGYLVILARWLSPASLGIYGYGVALYLAYLPFAQYGQFLLLASRMGARRVAREHLLAHSLALRLLSTLLIGGLGAGYVVSTEVIDGDLIPLLMLVATLVPRSLAHWAREAAVAGEHTRWVPRVEAGFRGSEMLLGTTCLLLGGDLNAICAVHLATWSIESIAVLCLVRDHLALASLRRLRRRYLIHLARRSLWPTLAGWLSYLPPQIGIVILRALGVSAATLGQLTVATQFYTMLVIVPMALGQVSLPALSRTLRRTDPRPLWKFGVLLRLCVVGGGLLALAASGVAPLALSVLLGPAYTTAGEVFAWLCWSSGPYAGTLLLAQILHARQEWRRSCAASATMVAVQVLVVVAVGPEAPLPAVAFGAGAGASTAFLLNTVAARQPLGTWTERRLFAAFLLLVVTAAGAVFSPLSPAVTVPILVAVFGGLAVGSRIVSRRDLAYLA